MHVLIISTASTSWTLSKLATEGFKKELEGPGVRTTLKSFLLSPGLDQAFLISPTNSFSSCDVRDLGRHTPDSLWLSTLTTKFLTLLEFLLKYQQTQNGEKG